MPLPHHARRRRRRPDGGERHTDAYRDDRALGAGIDFKGIDCVFDRAAKRVESYIHVAGRTRVRGARGAPFAC